MKRQCSRPTGQFGISSLRLGTAPPPQSGARGADRSLIMTLPGRSSRARRGLDVAGSGCRACGPRGIRCCCCGCWWCSCSGSRRGGSSDCCSRSRRAKRARGRIRLARRVKPTGAKDRLAQTPGVRVLGVRDLGPHAPQHFFLGDRALSPTVAQAPQAVAEAAHVLFRQRRRPPGSRTKPRKGAG